VLRYDSSSSARSNDSGDVASAFSAFGENNPLTIVETVQEGNSDDGDGWPEGEGHAGHVAGDDVQVNEISMAYDSAVALGVNTASSHTAKNLVIDTNDPGRGDFVISVRALGNASGTPLDGSQNVSFGEEASPKQRRIVDSAAKAAAYAAYRSSRRGWSKGVKVDGGS